MRVRRTPNYYKQLDALRFFAVLSVMVAHWIVWNTDSFIVSQIPWSHGVLFFFVLSGFLITEILLKSKSKIDAGFQTMQHAVKTFLIRRTLRIFPLYYFVILVLYFLNFENTRDLLPYLLSYSTNIYQSITNEYIGSFSHFWSLAVEEQFYLFWPIVVLLIAQRKIGSIIIGTVIISVSLRIATQIVFPEKMLLAQYFTPTVMYSLGIGGLLAYMKNRKPAWFKLLSANYLLAPLLIIAYFVIRYYKWVPSPWNFFTDEFLYVIISALIIARAVGSGYKFLGKLFLESPILIHLGQITYGLYVFHLFAAPVIAEYILPLGYYPQSKEEYWIWYFVFTLLLAELSYFIIERPINGLKKHFT